MVVPTYNRPKFLRRLIGHYMTRPDPHHILVLDSSDAENLAQNKEFLAKHSEYVGHKIYPSDTEFGQKLAHGLKLVNTPYVSCCADDDFIYVDAIKEAVDFLEIDEDYVCAHGVYFYFNNMGGHSHNHESKDCTIHISVDYNGDDNESDRFEQRVFNLMRNYGPLFYGVFRTEMIRKVFESMQKIPSLHFQELFQSVAIVTLGKIKTIDKIYGARQLCEAAEPSRDRWQTYYWFWDNQTEFLKHYRQYCELVWSFCEDELSFDNDDREQFQKLMNITHSIYFARSLPPDSWFWENFDNETWNTCQPIKEIRNLFNERRIGGRATSRFYRLQLFCYKQLSNLRKVVKYIGIKHINTHVSRLNREVAAENDVPWNCNFMPEELNWLVGDKEFVTRYKELCRYMSFTG